MVATNKRIKIEMPRDFADTLMHTLDDTIALGHAPTDDDRLLVAALAEVSTVLGKRLGADKHKFSVNLTPVQAMALRVYYTFYVSDANSFLGHGLSRIARTVHKKLVDN
ncbi:hypothetical protein [Parasediminibacterium sp. JCM 36343]|uniref:hypothetical protein n=1 Tax=Parasediminibacterium sp. JCM 36343 TaxID=3374279 RepID=UPI00397B3B7A